MTLTLHGRVSTHQGGQRAALVCSKKAHTGCGMIQRKPVSITSNTGTTIQENKSCVLYQCSNKLTCDNQYLAIKSATERTSHY